MSGHVQATEHALKRLFDTGDHKAAATLALREYGPEILGVLTARLRSAQAAGEVFSEFSEDLWRGLPSFRWQCSFRVWAYTLARHAALRHIKSETRRGRRQLPLSQLDQEVTRLADGIRSSTLAHLRTEVKSRMRQLREGLPVEEQELLILRIDKTMSWKDLARVLSDPEQAPSEAEIDRHAARLRKRFQLAKEKLRALAEREGLV